MNKVDRDWLLTRQVFLDGKPAKIVGRLLDFAVVTDGIRSFEWSWVAADRICRDKRGLFSTK